MEEKWLSDDDLLNETHHYIVTMFFLLQNKNDLIEKLWIMSKGKGFGYHFCICTFPNDLDEYEIATQGTFEGVQFAIQTGGEVVITNEELIYYVRLVCRRYIEKYPEEVEEIRSILWSFRDTFGLQVGNYNTKGL